MDLLAEIRAAFPVTPYPGDCVLSDCWCEECAWEVRRLRGKSWKQAKIEDFNASDGGRLSRQSFRYYLPSMLSFAVQYPDELHFASEINARFTAIAPASDDQIQMVQQNLNGLSKHQRTTLVSFFEWLREQSWQSSLLIDAAICAINGNGIVPVEPASLLNEYQEMYDTQSNS
jgi:hypothetical protein